LIFTVIILHKRRLNNYKQYLYVLTVGFLRWISASNSSLLVTKPFKWDRSWVELCGGQGAYKFLIIFYYLDPFKYLGLGLILFFVLFFVLLRSCIQR
jgi:hypothetical protein